MNRAGIAVQVDRDTRRDEPPRIVEIFVEEEVEAARCDIGGGQARQILGPSPLIGVSTHTPEQVRRAVLDGASYIGVGPAFASSTKQFGQLAGVEFVRQATAMTTLPAFIIGGVNADTIGEAVAAGAKRVAVCAAICQADDPAPIAARLRAALP